MSYLFFDTETTGFINEAKRLSDPCQPYLVQLGALLTDDDGHEVASLDVVIKPDGWVIPPAVSTIHGITTEFADEFGISMVSAVFAFMQMRRAATMIVAHNLKFDKAMLDICELRMPPRNYPDWPEHSFCTQEASVHIVNLPPTDAMLAKGMRGPKTPKLVEAYAYFFGKPFEGAHNAMVDVRACKDVFFHLKGLETTP